MPVIDKLGPELVLEETYPSSAHADLMTQVHQATYSPSPSRRILQDPSLIPIEASGKSKHKSRRKHSSRSPKRRSDHSSLVVAAIAIAEEERQGMHLKSLLRKSGEHLEEEMRRATEATMRADFAERREKEALSRANEEEARNEELKTEITHLERDMRSYQMQLEASELAVKRLEEDLSETRREMREIERGERKAQEQVLRYHAVIQEYERAQLKVQKVVDKSYDNGREDGYDEGYDAGFEMGLKQGVEEGTEKGRKERLAEARVRPRGHRSEIQPEGVFERIVANDLGNRDGAQWAIQHERTRRWTEAVQRDDININDRRSEDSRNKVDGDHV